jgi:hypothetical protein
MISSRPPFVRVNGQPYLVVNFDLQPDELPPLRDLVYQLLTCHAERDLLLLRPLSRAEARLLQGELWHTGLEAWARIVARPEDRFRARPRGRRPRGR